MHRLPLLRAEAQAKGRHSNHRARNFFTIGGRGNHTGNSICRR